MGRYAGGEPYETGTLDVGDGQQIYWEQSVLQDIRALGPADEQRVSSWVARVLVEP